MANTELHRINGCSTASIKIRQIMQERNVSHSTAAYEKFGWLVEYLLIVDKTEITEDGKNFRTTLKSFNIK